MSMEIVASDSVDCRRSPLFCGDTAGGGSWSPFLSPSRRFDSPFMRPPAAAWLLRSTSSIFLRHESTTLDIPTPFLSLGAFFSPSSSASPPETNIYREGGRRRRDERRDFFFPGCRAGAAEAADSDSNIGIGIYTRIG